MRDFTSSYFIVNAKLINELFINVLETSFSIKPISVSEKKMVEKFPAIWDPILFSLFR